MLDGIQPEGEAGPTYYAAFSVNGGSLAYSKGAAQQSQLVWWDRTGKKLQAASAPGTYDEPALSPDGRRVALDVLGSRNSVWVLDLARGALSRLSFEDRALCALWSPDGQQIAYRAVETTGSGFEFSIVVRPSSGTGNTTSLIRLSSQDRGDQMFPDSWSPDGRMLVVENGVGEFGNRPDAAQRVYVGLWLLPLGGDGKLQPFLSGPFNAAHASLSPDGRWLAYSSDETGRSEIYVQDFPRRSKKIQVSTNGGDQASWNHNGKELFYLSADQKLMVVAVSTQGEFKAGVPHMLFHAPISSGGLLGPRINYAVGPDGTRILMNVLLENSQQQSITMVVSWIEELNKK